MHGYEIGRYGEEKTVEEVWREVTRSGKKEGDKEGKPTFIKTVVCPHPDKLQ